MQIFTQTWLDVLAVDDFERITNVYDYVSAAIQPQYAHSPRIRALCDMAQDEIDATNDLENVQTISSLDGAYGLFLDWLGERIGTSRTIESDGQTLVLDDLLYASLLRWKAAQNLSASDAVSLNTIIEKLVGTKITVLDTGAMTMTLKTTEVISSEMLVLLRYFAPEFSPAGVGVIFLADYASVFGFNGQQLSLFNYGIFNTSPIS